ncbi:MAG: hypothetical protein V8R91_03210 [Butyricimonas faecihominis]
MTGEVTYSKDKRGNGEIIVTSKAGEVKKYLVSLSKRILVQETIMYMLEPAI